MKIKLTLEIELDEIFSDSEDDKLWLENEVLVGDGNLVLYSNDISGVVGAIKKVTNIQYLKT